MPDKKRKIIGIRYICGVCKNECEELFTPCTQKAFIRKPHYCINDGRLMLTEFIWKEIKDAG